MFHTNDKVWCIGHRGAASLAPENTLVSAGRALAAGADMWELDVSLTADGQLIVLHDDTLARTTNAPALFPDRAPWPLPHFTLAEVKQLDAGSWFVETDPFGTIAGGVVSPAAAAALQGEPVPTLREALAWTKARGWRVNVEIKELPPGQRGFPIVPAVVELIEALDMVEQVLLSSFASAYLHQAQQLNPTLATAALLDVGQDWPAELPFDAVHPFYAGLEAGPVRAARQAGLGVNPWTVNEPAEMRRLVELGVSGFITDFPQALALSEGAERD